MENQQITGGNIIKLQKPNINSFINVTSKNSKKFGDCNLCKEKDVDVEDHFCKSVIDSDELDITNIYDTDPMITSIDEFKKKLLKESKERVEFTDKEISYYKKIFSMQNIKYINNKFFSSIMSQLENKKQLSKKQLDQLKYLLKTGKSMYDDGYLTTKN